MKIIPAIDLIDGKCVRLSKGDYDTQKEYPATPVEMAQKFEDVGITYLHLVDLDGARAGVPKNLSVLRAISESTNLQVDFSGGLRTEEDIAAAFKAGATFVAVGSAAVKDPGEVSRWLSKFGAERFVLGADVRGQKLAVSGWQEDTDVTITEYVSRWRKDGVARFLCTSIEKDGLLEGPDFELYERLQVEFPNIEFIVSGGVSSTVDLERLRESGAQSVIIGKAIYEGKISLEELKNFLC